MEWRPILDGWQAVDAIAAQLADATEPAPDLALFWTYLAAARPEFAPQAERAIERLVDDIVNRPPDAAALDGGLAGAGWVLAHVADVEDILAIIDRKLLDLLAPDAWTGDYDLLGGLVGFGAYFLARDHVAGLARVRHHLAAMRRGSVWFTTAEMLPAAKRSRFPSGMYDCGLAHGVPGAIALLGKLAARGDDAAARMRDDAVAWLAAQRMPDGFPEVAGGRLARVAWCYGDPGVSLALHHAGHTPDFGWMTRDTGVGDAYVCHGAAGLAHICNRFYQVTGDAAHLAVARAWLERTLAYPHEGTSLLTGATGVGLVLLAALTDVEPAWDALLLCDVTGSR